MKMVSYSTLIVFAILLSFCSFSYELLLAKTIGTLTNSTVVVQSVTIGIYILFLGIGTLLCGRKEHKNPQKTLFNIEILLAISGALCVGLVMFMHAGKMYYFMSEALLIPKVQEMTYYEVVKSTERIPYIVFIILAQCITAWIGLLSGYEIPLLVRMAEELGYADKENEVIGYGALGTLLATICFAFIFIKIVDVDRVAVIIASLNLVLAYAILKRWNFTSMFSYGVVIICALVLSVSAMITPWVYQMNLKVFYYYDLQNLKKPVPLNKLVEFLEEQPDVQRKKTPYQYIDIVKKPAFNAKESDISLYLNQHFQLHVVYKDDVYHEGMAHVPVNLVGSVPRKILVLGAGDGLLIRELLKYEDQVESITHIELDEKMLELANTHPVISDVNELSLKHEKVTTHLMDAFYYVRNSKEKYDAIYIDFPYPYNYDLVRLYSKEFLVYVSRLMRPHGYIVMDVPLYDSSETHNFSDNYMQDFKTNNAVFLNTVHAAGMNFLTYDVGTDPFILMFFGKNELVGKFDKTQMFRYYRPKLDAPRQVRVEHYDYELDETNINSIFHPKLININNEY